MFKIIKKQKQRDLLKNAAIMIFFRLFCLEIVYRSNCPICLVAHIWRSGSTGIRELPTQT